MNEFRETGEAISIREDGRCLVRQQPNEVGYDMTAIKLHTCLNPSCKLNHDWGIQRGILATLVLEIYNTRGIDE